MTPSLRSLAVTHGRLLAAWTAVGLIFAVQRWMQDAGAPGTDSLPERLLHLVPFYLLWAGLTPLVVRTSERLAAQRANWPHALLTHAATAVGITLVHTALYTPYASALDGIPLTSLGDLLPETLVRRGVGHFVTYGAVVGLWHFMEESRRARASELAASHLAARLADARLDALRAQLNPHFLFNALNSVSSLVRRARGEDAVRAIVQLSALLRRSLDDDRQSAGTLADEVELCEQYLQLEQIRFSDRLVYSIAMSADTETTACPAFLLQPLVENAVHHGVTEHAGPATIRLTSARVGDVVRIVIWNSGSQLSETVVEGVGLANTRARLAWVHGDRASLALAAVDGGVATTVELPTV